MTDTDSLSLVKAYAGTVVADAVRALAVIAVNTRPDPSDTISEASKTALRVTEAARLLCAIGLDYPFRYLTDAEQADLSALFTHFTPPEPEPPTPEQAVAGAA